VDPDTYVWTPRHYFKYRNKRFLLFALRIIVGAGLLFILFETVVAKRTGFEGKTLWDWMELLVIPIFVAIGAFYLNRSEAKLEREIATDRQQEAALQSYIDRMSELLLKEKLRESENQEVRNVARIRTLTVLRALGPRRRGMVLQFLQESELITSNKVILEGASLSKASLRGAELHETNLANANLDEAILIRANLSGANLAGARLSDAYLNWANLNESNLTNASLFGADLGDASLIRADLTEAKVSNEQLALARSLKGAIMPDGTKHK
jgi:hypothetical protein